MLAPHIFFTREHLVGVAADRVYLAVVNYHSVWVRPLPAWIGVGRKTRMNQRDRAFKILVAQVGEKVPQIADQEHSLVYYCTRGKRNNIGVLVALLKDPSCNIQLAVKLKSPLN